MKKILIVLSSILILGIFFIYFFNNNNNKEVEKPILDEEEVSENDIDVTINKVEELLNSMTLEDKIGQMIIVATSSSSYDEALENLLKEVKPGGVILFKDNITTYEKTTKLISDIKKSSTIPMLIGIDQEGGKVQRIKNLSDANVLEIPSMYDLGKTNDEKLAYDVGSVIGSELNAFGINLDFAPVVDIYSNKDNTVIGTRSFGNDEKTVIKMAIPLANGLKDSGVIAVYKHFPGHGDTSVDSHYELPIINKTKEQLYELELKPYIEAIKNNAEVIMIGHLALPNITNSDEPASLSKKIVSEMLRDELGFNGVVITDALNMKAITDNYSMEEMCEKLINAKVDLLLMPNNPQEIVKTIKKLIQDNKITEKQIDEAVMRILLLKENNLTNTKTTSKEVIGSKEHQDIIAKINKIKKN